MYAGRPIGLLAAGTFAAVSVLSVLVVAAGCPPAGADPVPSPAAVGVQAVLPVCSTEVAPGSLLSSVPTTFLGVPGAPFGVAVSRDGRWAFVGLSGSVGVFSLTSSTTRPVRYIPTGNQDLGVALTPDGRYLLVADGAGGVDVIDVGQAETGEPGALVGTLNSEGSGAIETAVSPDGRYVFVTLEDSQEMAVFDLQRALADHLRTSDLVGMVPLEQAPVGVAIAPDHRYLYATSEAGGSPNDGTLTTIDLARAESDPSRSVVSTVLAGCSPVRVVATRTAVFVTARGSDALVEFSAPRLVSAPNRALRASLLVGEAPVGLALVNGGTGIVVADSNRFDVSGASANLAVVHVAASGALGLVGYVPSGSFPRDVAVTPGGRRALVCNYSSDQLERVKVMSSW